MARTLGATNVMSQGSCGLNTSLMQPMRDDLQQVTAFAVHILQDYGRSICACSFHVRVRLAITCSAMNRQALGSISLRQPRIPVFCNATGEAVTSAEDAASHMAQATCAPVSFRCRVQN